MAERERFQGVSQRRLVGNARFLSARPRATYCPCDWRRRPIPRALGFLKRVRMFHVTCHCCSRQQSPGQQAKVPRTAAGRPRGLPLLGAQPVSLVSESCSQPASQCHPDRWLGSPWTSPACPGQGLSMGVEQGGGGRCLALAELPEPLCNPVTFWAAPLGLEAPPCVPVGGSTRSWYPGRQVSHSVGSVTGTEPGTGLALWLCSSASLCDRGRVRSRGVWAFLPHRRAVSTGPPTPESGTESWDSARRGAAPKARGPEH